MKTVRSLTLPAGYFASGLEILTRIFAEYAEYNG